jgi:hypothetical protein
MRKNLSIAALAAVLMTAPAMAGSGTVVLGSGTLTVVGAGGAGVGMPSAAGAPSVPATYGPSAASYSPSAASSSATAAAPAFLTGNPVYGTRASATAATSTNSDGNRMDEKWGDPLNNDLYDSGSTHARLNYYYNSSAIGNQGGIGFSLTFDN